MLQFRASKSRPVWCVKLPAALTFPSDPKLLERIEQSRKTLPLNSIKSLRVVPVGSETAEPIGLKELRRAARVRAA
jgi:hypothetical protein